MKRMRILHFGFFDNQCIPTRSKHLESSNEIHFYIAHQDVEIIPLASMWKVGYTSDKCCIQMGESNESPDLFAQVNGLVAPV